jgi:YihY family inner membrane protein
MFDWLYGPILCDKVGRLGTYAAALAYCFVLSIIPFLVVTFTLGTELTHQNLVTAYSDLLVDILPSEKENPFLHGLGISHAANPAQAESQERVARVENLSGQIIQTLESSSHRGLATIGFILAVYTSFNLMNQIVRTLLFIYDDPRRPGDWTWPIVFKTLALFIIWMFLLLIFAAASVITPVLEKILSQAQLDPALWTDPILVMRNVAGMAFLYGAFFLTYLLVPTKHYTHHEVRNASLVASTGWVICSLVFSYVLPKMMRTNAVYEALGSVVIILLWAQACAWSVIIGACWMVRFPSGRKPEQTKAA